MVRLLVAVVLFSGVAEARGRKRREEVPPAPEVEAPPARATLPCGWEEGATFQYDHVMRRSDAQDPALAAMYATSRVTVTVVAAEGNRTLLRYDQSSPVFVGPADAPPGVRMAFGAAPTPEVEAPTVLELEMVDGNVTGVTNFLAVADAIEPVLRAGMPEAPEAVIAQTLALFRDPKAAPVLLLKGVAPLFALHCVTMGDGEVVQSPVSFASPFGELAGHSRITAAYDAEAQVLSLQTERHTDPDALAAMVPAAMARLAPPGTPIADLQAALAALPPIDTSMGSTMAYSVEDGFPLSVDARLDIGGASHPYRRSESWLWTRVDP